MSILDTELPGGLLRLFRELNRREIPYLVVGMAGAIMQGATGTTQDIDLWFEQSTSEDVIEAFRAAGGVVWRASSPIAAGPGFELLDLVRSCSGLEDFAHEFRRAVELPIAPGIDVKVMPLHRIIRSKTAAGRPKDVASLPMLRDTLRMLRKM